MKKIEKLTSAQEAAIPDKIKKWETFEQYTDVEIADAAIKLYNNMGYKKVEVKIFDSPYACEKHVRALTGKTTSSGYYNSWWRAWAAVYEFAADIGVEFSKKEYDLFLNFNSRVFFSVPFDSHIFISRNPVEVNWRNGQLHADGKKAIRFADDWGLYSYNGVNLPDHIGSVPSSEWEARWVLEAERADLRAVLVSGIGPKKFIEKIGGKCLDHFYSTVNHSVAGEQTQIVELFEPDFSVFNPANKFRILHLTCPSTGHDHYHWVPHNITTAKDAYTWFWKGREPHQMAQEA